jgi:hypothetical protein
MKCSICGTEQKVIGMAQMYIEDEKIGSEFPVRYPEILTSIKNKDICDNCMEIYQKIHSLFSGEDCIYNSKEYYGDGRNIPENS